MALTFLKATTTGAANPGDRRQPSLPARRGAARIGVHPCAPQRTVTVVFRNHKGTSHGLVAKIGAPLVGSTVLGLDDGRVGVETAADFVDTGAAGRIKRACQKKMIRQGDEEGLTS